MILRVRLLTLSKTIQINYLKIFIRSHCCPVNIIAIFGKFMILRIFG